MSANFDPYYKWLGIAPKDQPPNHYRLLGLENFEEDLQVVESASDRQLGFLRRHQSGEHAADCQKLLNEVTRARLCLLKPASKAAYDQELRQRLDGGNEFAKMDFGEEVPPDGVSQEEFEKRPKTKRDQKTTPLGMLIPALIGGALAALVVWIFVLFRGNQPPQVVIIKQPAVSPPADAHDNHQTASAKPASKKPDANDKVATIDSPSRPIPSDKSDEVKSAFYGRGKPSKDRKPERNDLVRPPKAPDENKSPLKVGETVDLLTLIDLQRDTVRGKLTRQGNSIVTSEDGDDLVAIPYVVPPEYTLTIDLESKVRKPTAYVAFPVQGNQAMTVWGNNRGDTDILHVDGVGHIDYHKRRWMKDRATNPEGKVLTDLRSKIVYVVRKNHLQVRVGDKVAYDWRGDFRRFLPIEGLESHTNHFVIGGHKSGLKFHSVKLQRLPDSSSPFIPPSRPADNNLLSIINPERDTTLGKWDMDGVLTSMMDMPSSIRFPIELPRNYEVQLIVERKDPGELFEISLPVRRKPTIFALDGYRGTAGGLELADGKRYDHNSLLFKYESYQLPVGEVKVIRAVVEEDRLTVYIDGKQIFHTNVPGDVVKGTPEVARPNWLTPQEQLQLAITTDSTFDILDVRFRSLDSASPAFPRLDLAALKNKPSTPTPSANDRPAAKPISVAVPVPDAAAREVATKKVREAFSTEFSSAKKDADKLALASKLETLSNESQEDPAAKYACLEMARDLFAEAGDLTRALGAVETLCSNYEVDALELKSSLMKSLGPKVKGPLLNKELIEKLFPLIDEMKSTEHFSQAVELATLAGLAAGKAKDKAAQADAGALKKESEELAKEFAVADAARKTLESNADDAAAKLIWGRWLCLQKAKWDEGLPLLAGGDNAQLKSLAERDLKIPADKAAMVELADGWVTYAKSEKDHREAQFADRAMFWLQKAVEQSSGLEKSRNEQLLAKALEVRDWDSPLLALLDQVEKKVQQGRFLKSTYTVRRSGDPFEALTTPPGILVGMNLAVRVRSESTSVKAIQPIYFTRLGLRFDGWHGDPEGTQQIEVRARPGYAINGVAGQVDNSCDNMQISFGRVTRLGIDSARTYHSPLIGMQTQNQESLSLAMSGNQPIIGMFGNSDKWLYGFGVIFTK